MNQTLEFYTSKGYGVFPYIIIREMGGIYRQIPIHISLQELLSKEGVLVNPSGNGRDFTFKERSISTLENIIKSEPVITNKRKVTESWIFSNNKRKEGCVVLSPKKAVYLDCDGQFIAESDKIPWGGKLISMCGETIVSGEKHYDFLEK